MGPTGRMSTRLLAAPLVLELGERAGTASCGSLLAELGAEVVLVEVSEPTQRCDSKMVHRSTISAGKRSLVINPARPTDIQLLTRLIERADVVLTSSDIGTSWPDAALRAAERSAIVCDISAYGNSGPMAGVGHSDACVQAFSGLADTTGCAAGMPTLCVAPIVEFTAGTYAAAGVIAALRARRLDGRTQKVEVALHDVAISCLSTFLPTHHVGGSPTRVGNRHPGIAPWNAYRTTDGWILIGATSDDQWARICGVMGRPELAVDPAFAILKERVRNVAELDAQIEEWTCRHQTAHCVGALSTINISCGPVYALADLFRDPNILHRGSVIQNDDPESGRTVRLSGPLFPALPGPRWSAWRVPRRDEDRGFIERLVADRSPLPTRSGTSDGDAPLAGVRVLEVGQYTTAPLAGRQLGALGADVVKIEPPTGDLARGVAPQQNGQSYFFTIGNSDKRTIIIDLHTEAGKKRFSHMVAKADVLVQNLRPDALTSMGFPHSEIMRLNPRIIHCSISGFGHDAHYVARPAMDATIQGMSALMDLTRSDGVPYKVGISLADIAGGQFALLAILAALEARAVSERGQHIDLSMQDIAAWYTRFSWNGTDAAQAPSLPVRLQCLDGHVVVDALAAFSTGHLPLKERHEPTAIMDILRGKGLVCAPVLSVGETQEHSRIEVTGLSAVVMDVLRANGFSNAPVQSVSAALEHPQSKVRELVVDGRSKNDLTWPLLACPIRLSHSLVRVRRAISPAGGDEEDILRDWGLDGAGGRPSADTR